MAPPKSPEEARQTDIAQKSESMARDLSYKREMRIRQERGRLMGTDPSDRASLDTAGQGDTDEPVVVRHSSLLSPREPRLTVLDDVAAEIDDLATDLRSGFRRLDAPDRITLAAALFTLFGVLLPWTSNQQGFTLGIASGGALHAALAVTTLVLLVSRASRERAGGRGRSLGARRVSLWYALLGACSTALCAYFLVVYGIERLWGSDLEVRFGLYLTLAAGMGLSYGGFARFFKKNHE